MSETFCIRLLSRTLAALPLAALALSGLYAAPAAAEPYFAVREGYKCGTCHVNRTGGGKRTAFGFQYSRNYLSLLAAPGGNKPKEAAASVSQRIGSLVDPFLNDHVSLGANLRLANRTTFAKQVHNTFTNQEANFYAQLDLSRVSRRLMVYADLSLAEGNIEGREALAMVSLWRSLYLKAGYFLLPFGLRIWGDDQFTRAVTGYNYASPDLGIELGWDGDVLSVFFAVSNGTGGSEDSDNYKKLSLATDVAFRQLRFGLSAAFHRSDKQSAYLGGATFGLSLGRFTALGEIDMLATIYHDKPSTVMSLLAYGELNALIYRGINLKISYGHHDPALDRPEDQRFALRAAVELFPLPSLATTISYTLRQSVPQDEIGNADTLFFELHFYL